MKAQIIILLFSSLFLTACFKPIYNPGEIVLKTKQIEKTALIQQVIFSHFHKNICHNFGINQDTTKSFKSLEILNQFVFYKSGYQQLISMDIIFEKDLIELFPCIAREENEFNELRLIMVMISEDKKEVYWSCLNTSTEKLDFYCSKYSDENRLYKIEAMTHYNISTSSFIP